MASWFERNLRIVVIAIVALLAAAIVYFAVQQRNEPPALEIDFGEATPGGPIEVYITGAVAEPGVYEIDDGARVVDLLNEAGGPAPDADLEAINLAQRLSDEDQVVVPRQGQAAGAQPGATSQVAGTTTPVNINTATQDELMALQGIGEAYSQRIIDSRSADGPFASTEELVSRRILPRATYERIRDQVTVGP